MQLRTSAGISAAYQRRNLVLGIRRQHHERIFDTPVGRVGHVGHARESVETNVVVAGMPLELPACPLAQLGDVLEFPRERFHRLACRAQQLADLAIALGVVRTAPPLDFVEPVMQRFDQQPTPLRIVDQIVLQVRIALHDPDVAQHFVEHARGTPGAALGTQFVEDPPYRLTEQANDDLAIRKRSVVVRNLSQARRRLGDDGALRLDRVERQGQIQQGCELEMANGGANCSGPGRTVEGLWRYLCCAQASAAVPARAPKPHSGARRSPFFTVRDELPPRQRKASSARQRRTGVAIWWPGMRDGSYAHGRCRRIRL